MNDQAVYTVYIVLVIRTLKIYFWSTSLCGTWGYNISDEDGIPPFGGRGWESTTIRSANKISFTLRIITVYLFVQTTPNDCY